MSRFRKVDGGTWGDSRFRDLSQDAKFLWFYLLTGPQVTSLPGVLVLGKATIQEALDWTPRRLTNALTELTRTTADRPVPMVKADWKSRLIWLPNAAKHNLPANPSTVQGWRDHWRCTPECDLRQEIEVALRAVLAGMSRDKLHEYLAEFDYLTGKGPLPSRQNGPPPSHPPTTPQGPPPTLPPANPPSLVCARTAPAPAPVTAVSEGVQGVHAASPPETPPSRGARPEGVPKNIFAMHRTLFVDAYVEAVRDVTGVAQWTMPAFGPRDLEALLANWCTGAARASPETWIDRTVREFAESQPTGYEPARVVRFLNDRATRSAAAESSVQVAAKRLPLKPIEPEPESQPEPISAEERAQFAELFSGLATVGLPDAGETAFALTGTGRGEDRS